MKGKWEWEWVVRRLPPMPKYRSVRQSMTLSKKALAEECWAARVNSECSMESASEAWARAAELVEMLEGKRGIDRSLLKRLKAHRAHVIKCRTGSCEHEYAALVRARLAEEEK
jgi:hypothetical protein